MINQTFSNPQNKCVERVESIRCSSQDDITSYLPIAQKL